MTECDGSDGMADSGEAGRKMDTRVLLNCVLCEGQLNEKYLPSPSISH